MNIILVVFGHGIKSLELGNFMVEWGLCVNIYIYIYMYTHISVARMIRLPMFGHVCSVQHILMMCKRCSCRIYRKQKFVRIDRGKSVFERIFFSLNYTLSLVITKSLYNIINEKSFQSF